MSVKPKNSEATVAETTMLKTGRKLEEGFPSESAGGKAKKPRLADKVELSKEINPKQKNTTGKVSMCVDRRETTQNGDISRLEAERIQAGNLKVKKVWKLALSRNIQRDGVGFKNCNEKRLQDLCISMNNNDTDNNEPTSPSSATFRRLNQGWGGS